MNETTTGIAPSILCDALRAQLELTDAHGDPQLPEWKRDTIQRFLDKVEPELRGCLDMDAPEPYDLICTVTTRRVTY